MATTELNLILDELKNFNGRVHLGLPKENLRLNSRDLIFLMKWTPEELLKIARSQSAQVALFSTGIIPEPLSPFYDWRVFEKDSAETLTKMAHIFEEPTTTTKPSEKSALFLDRDGVVNVDHGYVGDPSKVDLIPHVAELIKKTNLQHKDVIIVTNQSGIGREFYTTENFDQVMHKIFDLLKVDQAKIDLVEHSPFHPSAKEEKFRFGRQFRKPRPGMLHHASQERGINLKNSVMIGDHTKDLMTAVLAGVGQVYLFSTESAEEMALEFQTWIEDLKYKHQLHSIMTGVQFRVLNGLNEVQLWH